MVEDRGILVAGRESLALRVRVRVRLCATS